MIKFNIIASSHKCDRYNLSISEVSIRGKTLESDYGEVVDIIDNKARVRVEVTDACKHCKVSSVCVPEEGQMRCVTAIAPEWVKVGQKVKLEIPARSRLLASLLVYIIPLMDMLVGAILGYYLGIKLIKNVDPQLVAAGFAFLFLIISFLVMRLINKCYEKSDMFIPRIVEKVENDSRKR